jgi:hypothetical protein
MVLAVDGGWRWLGLEGRGGGGGGSSGGGGGCMQISGNIDYWWRSNGCVDLQHIV